jgi:dTDP-4-dehydrorhamnose 3,5-epimerase
MKSRRLKFPEVLLLEPEIFKDERGFFYESFNKEKFEKATGKKISFVQDNFSKSNKNTLRGLHYQVPPMSQGKLVTVLQGEIYDVVVDLRKSSETFGDFLCQELNAVSKQQLWIPEGFAHGFLVTSDFAEVMYKTTNFYHPDSERSILWNDPNLLINWPNHSDILLSAKDKKATSFLAADCFIDL